MDRCPNCSAELTGEYCARCGQKRIRPGDLSLRRFLHEMVEEWATLRGRFKTVRSLGALAKPGVLTTEYLSGRRQAYLGPLKLYFVCAAIFFFTAPWAGFELASMLEGESSGPLAKQVEARMEELHLDREHFASRFDLRVKTVYTLSTTIHVIAIAVALQLLSRRRPSPFGSHVIFALHFMAAVYLITMLTGVAVKLLGWPLPVAAGLGVALMAVYLMFALRRTYGESIPATLWKGAALWLLTMILNNAVSWFAILLTLRLV